jgi:hypothetical protein
VKHLLSAVALVVAAANAEAQVGSLPQNSPYRDVETSQEITFFGGRYSAGKDALGVAPHSGPLFGIRYEKHVGGPAFITARWSHVNSERLAIDPTKTGAAAQLGIKDVSLNIYDLSLALNLTGQKSFHHIVPVVNFGVGLATCGGCSVDLDPFKFGTPFAFSLGGGLRFVPGGRFQLRLDWNDYLYQIKYPAEYFVSTTAGGPAAPSSQERSFWKNNGAFTLGASLLFFR